MWPNIGGMSEFLLLVLVKLTLLHSPLTAAAGPGATGGFKPKALRAMTMEQKDRLSNALKIAKCNYAFMGDILQKEWIPSIYLVPVQCTGEKQKLKPICAGAVACHSMFLNFVVADAMCWAIDDKTCPSPRKCAEQSLVNSSEVRDVWSIHADQSPVYMQKNPVKGTK